MPQPTGVLGLDRRILLDGTERTPDHALRGKIALFAVALSVVAVVAANASASTAELDMTSIGSDRYTLTADVYKIATTRTASMSRSGGLGR